MSLYKLDHHWTWLCSCYTCRVCLTLCIIIISWFHDYFLESMFLFQFQVTIISTFTFYIKVLWKLNYFSLLIEKCLQCFDTVGWAAGRASGLWKIWGGWWSGSGHWLVRTEWCPAGWLVCLPLLIFPCTIKSRSSLLAPAHLGDPGKRAVKRLCVCEN